MAIQPTENIQFSGSIPAIPEFVQKFIALHGQDHISEQELNVLEQQSPDLFHQLLSVINSDHFNLTTKVNTIAQAIDHSGFERVCNLMLALVVHRTFSQITINGLDLDEFWEDSLRRAVSARLVGEIIGLDGSRCFVAGLLQDIGFLLLFLQHPDKAMLWSEFRKREPSARYIMERHTFGNMSHDQALKPFCKQWGLLDIIAVPLSRHHICDRATLDAIDAQLCRVLYCADWMASVYSCSEKSFVINHCRKILTDSFEMESYRTEELLAAIPDEMDVTAMVLSIKIKHHIEFSQILFDANIKLSEDNINFQELTLRLEQALRERDRLASELNRELGLAREIQQSLLPSDMDESFPLVGLNMSARYLSGDFFDYFRLPDGRIYFNLGDVSGKGVNAALLMTKTSSLFRCLGKRIDNPGELLHQINLELCETSIHGMFVTMIAGLYYPDSGLLQLVNAGNPPALLFTPEGLAYEIEAAAPPLGVIAEAEFPVREFQLDENSLYMFSDGVTEGLLKSGEMLGLSGLFKAIALMDRSLSPRQRIQKVVKRFQGATQTLKDDITVLLLEKQRD